MRTSRLVLLVTILLAASGCATPKTTSPTPTASSPAVELTVYAAASLKGPMDRIKAVYESTHPGTTLTVATDSSTALRTQIEQGAPADVFLSADTANPKALVDGGLSSGAAILFAGNKLAIIVPAANPANIRGPADLAKPGVKIVAAGVDVPITKYAQRVIDLLGKQPRYPADFAAGYAANVVSLEDNVTAIVAKVELGEGDAGIVYVTDAEASTKLASFDIPGAANVRADYASVVIAASKYKAAAQVFLAWLVGSQGQAILADFGFLPPP